MEGEALAKEFEALIRRLRFAKGYSQEGLAKAAKLERAYVGKIERGETNATVTTTPKLVGGLDLKLASFFSELEKELGSVNEEDRSPRWGPDNIARTARSCHHGAEIPANYHISTRSISGW